MSQSLYTSMGGIAAAQTNLNVISNNIANLNTTAFKTSSVNFSDVFSRTISSGSVATSSSGGTNPIQIGVGVKVSAVSKDFTSGSWIATGKNTDLMIQGSGLFAVQSSTDGQIYFTRAGDFSFDEQGNLVTSSGYKVLGTDTKLSSVSTGKTVYVPQSIIANPVGNPNIGTKLVSQLNNCGLTAGSFTVTRITAGVPTAHTITITQAQLDTMTTTQLVANMQTQLDTPVASGITVACANGRITFDGPAADDLTFTNPAVGASNFVVETGLNNAVKDAAGTYTSNILDYSVDVTQVTSASAAVSVSSYNINSDGSIQATYSNGDTLAVELGADGYSYQFVYTTSKGVKIGGADCNVDPNVAVPANFVIQMASVTNTDGLIAVGSNLYKSGPNSGDLMYTVGGSMGLGKIQSGGLEASNVDLSKEFSNMILAQRAVEANSRVFTTTSDVMSTVVQMGR